MLGSHWLKTMITPLTDKYLDSFITGTLGGITLDWFVSYLSDRKQKLKLMDCFIQSSRNRVWVPSLALSYLLSTPPPPPLSYVIRRNNVRHHHYAAHTTDISISFAKEYRYFFENSEKMSSGRVFLNVIREIKP